MTSKEEVHEKDRQFWRKEVIGKKGTMDIGLDIIGKERPNTTILVHDDDDEAERWSTYEEIVRLKIVLKSAGDDSSVPALLYDGLTIMRGRDVNAQVVETFLNWPCMNRVSQRTAYFFNCGGGISRESCFYGNENHDTIPSTVVIGRNSHRPGFWGTDLFISHWSQLTILRCKWL